MPTPLEERMSRARGSVTAALFAGRGSREPSSTARDGADLPDPAPTLLAALTRLTPDARAARITAWMRSAERSLDDLGIHRSWIDADPLGIPRASDPAWVRGLRQHLRRRGAGARAWSRPVELHPRAEWLAATPIDRLYAIALQLGARLGGRNADVGFHALGVLLADVPERDRRVVAERLHRDAGRMLLDGARSASPGSGPSGETPAGHDPDRIRSHLDDLLRRSRLAPVPEDDHPPHPGRTR